MTQKNDQKNGCKNVLQSTVKKTTDTKNPRGRVICRRVFIRLIYKLVQFESIISINIISWKRKIVKQYNFIWNEKENKKNSHSR